MNRGLINNAVSAYLSVKRGERLLAKREAHLDKTLKGLSKDEFDEYARMTMKMDAEEGN